MRKKLIEVALPLEAINKASAREKSIRHGHPSTLHLWWARRPLAAARAVIFSQMVDDPASCPEEFPTVEAQEAERRRLFDLIEELVLWENTTNEEVLQRARAEIRRSWARHCLGGERVASLNDAEIAALIDSGEIPPLPAFHDPFAGGGALPLEAQRLGLEAYASDLNPVAVLINKAMIEIPPRFAGQAPVNPEARDGELLKSEYHGAQGLAEDVRYYGQWMRDEAEKRIGHLYPKVKVTAEMAKERPDLKKYVGQELTVIAWIWARTVNSPNPAFADVDVPLASTFMLSTKKGKEAYVEVEVREEEREARDGPSSANTSSHSSLLSTHSSPYRFTVKVGKPKDPAAAKKGTKSGGSHSSFLCLMSGTAMPFSFLRKEARAGRLGSRLMAIVAEGDRGRVYLSPAPEHEAIAKSAAPVWKPEVEICHWPGRTNVVEYGMTTFGDLFTPRQLVALTTFSDLVGEAMERVRADALAAGLPDDPTPLRDGGSGATAYAQAVGVYLAFALSKQADLGNSLCRWEPIAQCPRQLFGRQAIPMVWDFAEGNPLGSRSGGWIVFVDGIAKAFVRAFEVASPDQRGFAEQADAGIQTIGLGKVISTDPPYYDNVGYADLSDFFYVWLRRPLRSAFPNLFATLAVPKAEELVATPYRHGGKDDAEQFFLDGMTQAMSRLAQQSDSNFPVTIYYAFKQSERRSDGETASTGWETFLDAVITSGFGVTGTWPMRTENSSRMIGQGTNALASSIVLVCRKRPEDAPTATRREFVAALKKELPEALVELQKANIAPVDLAQAAIGPGMAVFTRYQQVLDAEGRPVSVREALALINQVLDEALAEQEGDFDADTRWALAWFDQQGFDEGEYGVAETLSKAKNTSIEGMVHAGILQSRRGKVRLLKPDDLPDDWDPDTDSRLTHWEVVHHLIRVLETGGEAAAAELVRRLGSRAETARELAYRLYTVCERRKRAAEALRYNALVQSFPEIVRLSREAATAAQTQQPELFAETEE